MAAAVNAATVSDNLRAPNWGICEKNTNNIKSAMSENTAC